MTTCQHCSAPIVWARTFSGKNIALDAAPTAAGSWALSPEGIAEFRGKVGEGPARVNLHTAHETSCPGSIGHRP